MKIANGTVKILFADRARALENLARYLGMFSGKSESEEVSPLARLAQRIMAGAQQVPVATVGKMPQRETPMAEQMAFASETPKHAAIGISLPVPSRMIT